METTRCTAETLVFESDDCASFGIVHKAVGVAESAVAPEEYHESQFDELGQIPS